MGRKGALTDNEKAKIIQGLHKNQTTLAISKTLNRDHRTIKRFVKNPSTASIRSDKGKPRKNSSVSPRVLSLIKREIRRNPLHTSKEIFEAVSLPNVRKSTRCHILKRVGKCGKPVVRPPLRKVHRENRIKWAEKYMKVNFGKVLFTDECRATLDGPDGWRRGWYDMQASPPQRVRRQQGGGGVIIWAGIIDDEVVGPFRVKDGVKMTAEMYVSFLKEFLQPWYKKKSVSFRRNMIFMQDNAPSHAARFTTDFLKKFLVKSAQIMEWPACSPDLNPIENLWSVIKRKIYAGGKQFGSKDELWNAIQVAVKEISADDVKKLTSSVDRRLLSVVANHGAYIKY